MAGRRREKLEERSRVENRSKKPSNLAGLGVHKLFMVKAFANNMVACFSSFSFSQLC